MKRSKSTPYTAARLAFEKAGGTMRALQAIKAGVNRKTLYEMARRGVLEQVSRGLYRLSDMPPLSQPDLVAVAHKIPKGVLCLISALSFHGLTTQIPHEIYVAVPKERKSHDLTSHRCVHFGL